MSKRPGALNRAGSRLAAPSMARTMVPAGTAVPATGHPRPRPADGLDGGVVAEGFLGRRITQRRAGPELRGLTGEGQQRRGPVQQQVGHAFDGGAEDQGERLLQFVLGRPAVGPVRLGVPDRYQGRTRSSRGCALRRATRSAKYSSSAWPPWLMAARLALRAEPSTASRSPSSGSRRPGWSASGTPTTLLITATGSVAASNPAVDRTAVGGRVGHGVEYLARDELDVSAQTGGPAGLNAPLTSAATWCGPAGHGRRTTHGWPQARVITPAGLADSIQAGPSAVAGVRMIARSVVSGQVGQPGRQRKLTRQLLEPRIHRVGILPAWPGGQFGEQRLRG